MDTHTVVGAGARARNKGQGHVRVHRQLQRPWMLVYILCLQDLTSDMHRNGGLMGI